jgi:hypothetical protein
MKLLTKKQTAGGTPLLFALEWIRVNDAVRLFGIGRSSLFNLIRAKRIASKVLKTSPHNVSGLRLISVESLRALIQEAGDE